MPGKPPPTTLEEALAELAKALKREENLKKKYKKLVAINEQFLKVHVADQVKKK